MLLPRFECRQAGSLLQAATLLAENPEARALAGGTDLLVDLRERRQTPRLLDGQAINSCLALAVQAEGKAVVTVRGLGTPEALYAFLPAHPRASRHEIREAIGGNLCRCTGYHKIVDAAEAAARKLVSR